MTTTWMKKVQALALLAALAPIPANAQDSGRATSPTPTLMAAAKAEAVRLTVTDMVQAQQDRKLAGQRQTQVRKKTARKVGYGVALGFAGMFGGAMVGSLFTRNCRCDDPGLVGAMYGAPIGAAAGAAFGVWLGGR